MEDTDIRIPEEEHSEFTLEDIMKEFGSDSGIETVHEDLPPDFLADFPPRELLEDQPAAEAPPEDDDMELPVWTPRVHQPQAEPVQLNDTRAFAPVAAEAAATDGDTIRIDAQKVRSEAKPVSDDTVRFDTLGEEPIPTPEPFRVNPIPEGAEPFSANWEPEYDQPIGEYVPPEPIIFRPRSRLGELKRKLMEGPEQRYYALSEKGLLKLQTSLFVSMLIVVLAVASIILHGLDMVQENRMRLLVFGEIFAMLFSALLCWERLANGVGWLLKGKFTLDSLLVVSLAAGVADGIFCLRSVRVPFCAAFCLEVLMCLWSEYQARVTELSQMDTLRKATRLNRVSKAPDCYDGRSGFFVSEGQPEDFMDSYQQPSAPEKALGRYSLIALAASVAVAVAAGLTGGVETGLQTWSAAILAACPATIFICQTRPLHILQRRLHRFGSVICGWQGVSAARGRAVVPVSDEDLFPGGSVKINGVKFYSSRNPDTIIGYATAVMSASSNCLAPLFEHMLKSRRAQSFEVDAFQSYGDQGFGGIVCGESVLVGTQEFLKSMGVEMPAGTRVNQAIYVSIDGEFSVLFALSFGKLKGVSAGLDSLCGHRKLSPVLATCNFLLDEGFIRSKYGVDTRRISFPDIRDREKLSQWQPDEEKCICCALTTQEGLAGTAFAITGARNLRTASIAGAAIHILGGVLGMGAVLALTLVGRTDLLTPLNLLLFELIWAIPGLMISDWTRNL